MITKNYFIKLSNEWLRIEFIINQGDLTKEQLDKRLKRQLEIEKLQEECEWDFDGENNVVRKD